MKNICLFSFLLCSSCIATKAGYSPTDQLKNDPFGMGLLKVSMIDQDIPLYTSVDASFPFDTIKIRQITEGKFKGNFEFKTSTLNDTLQPFRMWQGSAGLGNKNVKIAVMRPALKFRVINKTARGYGVVLSEKDRRLAFISARPVDSTAFIFETWETYLNKIALVNCGNDCPVNVFDHPNGKIVDSVKNSELRVLNVNGFWMEVTYRVHDHESPLRWIKWRDNDKFLIGFMYYREDGA